MKKQFRLYDVYRTAITGERSAIKGITSYEVNKDCTVLLINYDNLIKEITYTANNEDELRIIIRRINKRLNNCRKPGRRRKYVNK